MEPIASIGAGGTGVLSPLRHGTQGVQAHLQRTDNSGTCDAPRYLAAGRAGLGRLNLNQLHGHRHAGDAFRVADCSFRGEGITADQYRSQCSEDDDAEASELQASHESVYPDVLSLVSPAR